MSRWTFCQFYFHKTICSYRTWKAITIVTTSTSRRKVSFRNLKAGPASWTFLAGLFHIKTTKASRRGSVWALSPYDPAVGWKLFYLLSKPLWRAEPITVPFRSSGGALKTWSKQSNRSFVRTARLLWNVRSSHASPSQGTFWLCIKSWRSSEGPVSMISCKKNVQT